MLAGLTRIGRAALIALGLFACLATMLPAQAALIWTWTYGAPGISAGGTITTGDVADSQGFYLITGISGTRNGIAITGLQPAGTAIPGNDPFVVDDLISASGPQLTGEGFGYSTADGNFANTVFRELPVAGHVSGVLLGAAVHDGDRTRGQRTARRIFSRGR